MSSPAWRAVHEDDELADVVMRPSMTFEEARQRTDEAALTLKEFQLAVIELWRGRADKALGYRSWIDYMRAEFVLLPQLKRLEKRTWVRDLAVEGMGIRQIAATAGVDRNTVRSVLAEVSGVGESHPVAEASSDCACCVDQAYEPTGSGDCAVCQHGTAAHEPDLHALHGNGDEVEPEVLDGREGFALGGGYRRVVDVDGPTVLDEVFVPGRESEWPEVVEPGTGVVVSETPGGETSEAPASVDPDVEYRRWRSDAKRAIARAEGALSQIAGDWLDADMVAARADEVLVDRLAQLAERLAAFLDNVRSLRAKAAVAEPAEPAVLGGPRPEPGEHISRTGLWYCQGCGATWPVVDGPAGLCSECGGKPGFQPPAEAAAEPAGDEVWMAVRRKGLHFHEMNAYKVRTLCMRGTHSGIRLPRVEAEELGTRCRQCASELADAAAEAAAGGDAS